MRSSKILIALLILCTVFSLASCNHLHFHNGNNTPQNQNNVPADKPEEQRITYVYSVTQEVLHLPTCSHVANMKPEYRVTYDGDISVLFAKGFTVCRDCLAQKEEDEDLPIEPDPDEVPAEEASYVVNRSSKTIHEKDCYNVEKMSEKNVKYTNLSYEDLIATEHIPCGFCMKEEYEAYKKANPDKFKDDK